MRYLKVRGKPGVLVGHPFIEGAVPAYVGQKRKKDAAKLREQVDRYEPSEEVVRDDAGLRKAIARGELELIAEGTGKDAASVVWAAKPAGKDS